MKKISIFSTYLGKVNRGAETFVIELTKELKKEFDVEIYSLGMVQELKENIKIVEYVLPKWLAKFTYFYNRFRIARFICDKMYYLIPDVIEQYYFNKALYKRYYKDLKKSDIIYPNNGVWGARLANKIRRNEGIPFIYTGHGGIGEGEKRILKLKPNNYIALTEKSKRWAGKYSNNIMKIYNGIDLNKYFEFKEQKNDMKIVLCVGAFTQFKRQKLLIDAIAKLKNVKLVLLGKGELEEEIKEYGYTKLKNRVEVNNVPYNEINEYYAKCDLFSLPSLNEPFGIVYLEALASNKPVVAPNDENRKEIIGEAGMYCNVENVDEYAEAIHIALYKEWGNIPLERAQEFQWANIARLYSNLIRSICE